MLDRPGIVRALHRRQSTRGERLGGARGRPQDRRRRTHLLHPANGTGRFIGLYEEIGPPVRLHDLRHSTATLAHVAGASLKDIQEMLGHSSITITADTYTSLLPEADLSIAEPAARLVLRARITPKAAGLDVDVAPGEASGSVPDDADPLGAFGRLIPRLLTQTPQDETSEVE